MSAHPDLVEYKANCHCGAFKFSFKAPKITKGSECDCSICSKNGYIWLRPSEGTFNVDKGDENTTLTSYVFGTKKLVHKFCPTCGTSVFARFSSEADNGPGAMMINVRAVQDLDIWSLQTSDSFKGSELGDAYQPPSHVAPIGLPTEDRTLYHGNCHCGSVAFVLANPAKVTTALKCNCSICGRDGVLWIYPQTSDIAFRGVPEFMSEYSFGPRNVYHGFCKVCGVAVYERFVGISDDGEDRALTRALNIRTFASGELDWDKLELELDDGRAFPPLYEVPA
ncbi:GFA domain-containing protein [Mycena indigotica]|uniref:GFA domain-containing protein n=1 Tax=Mycena indigotica TaxID=2126181 RepID=A0A8H6W5A0_9AGAR|nr:GFA domain-containing protein [Mycena indigotica]KAF7302283.1 GFA domain-containing protein [Mycena indigotica]